MKLELNLGLLSKYRLSLMGLAALMIIVCHAPLYGVSMPNSIGNLIRRGGLGVDIFLFLSGVGCWYSLSKGTPKKKWYLKRFFRIFIPYLFMQFPFWIFKLLTDTFSLYEELLVFSTIGFWLWHEGAWYVALLVPLYLITPFVYRILQCKNRLFIASVIIIVLTALCTLNIDMLSGVAHDIIGNVQWTFGRVPSFIIGMAIAPLVKRERKINILFLTIIPILLYICLHTFVSKDLPSQWCLVPPILSIYVVFLNMLNQDRRIFGFINWMGGISLESYLSNIYLCVTIKKVLSPLRDNFNLLVGGYFEYAIVILLGIFLAWIVNQSSKKVMNMLNLI